MAVSIVGNSDRQFEGQTENTVGRDSSVPTAGERGGDDMECCSKVTRGLETCGGNNSVDENVAPSSGKSENVGMLRKPRSTLCMSVNVVDNLDEEVECVHKRGFFCTTHGSMGEKYIEKSKVWSKPWICVQEQDEVCLPVYEGCQVHRGEPDQNNLTYQT